MAKLKETDASIDEYMELWDMALDDNAKLVEENKKLAMQIEQLKIVRQYCEENNMVKSGECADNVILDINQQEMYPGEMYNFVLFCLELALKSVPKDTRKYDTIKAILDLNPQTKSKERERIVNVIEEALTQGKLDLLKKVDFEIVYGKKHPIVSQSFSKRSMPVPGTPGGGRSEQNTIADLKRLFLL